MTNLGTQFDLLIDNLDEARRRAAACRLDMSAAEDALRLGIAQAEQRAIEAAGGDKGLGANAEARARALLLVVDADQEVQGLRAHLYRAMELRNEAEADLATLGDQLGKLHWIARVRMAEALEVLGGGQQLTTNQSNAAADAGAMRAVEKLVPPPEEPPGSEPIYDEIPF